MGSWSGGSVSWSIVLYTHRLGVRFLVMAPHLGCGSNTWFLSLKSINMSSGEDVEKRGEELTGRLTLAKRPHVQSQVSQ